MMKTFAIALSAAVLLLTGSTPQRTKQVFFDDFSYTSTEAMKKNGWIIRTEPGWPGIPGATWSEQGVSLM